jgi:uncharacterized membrane-anchored protein YhcB (DUF1043 family)
MVDSVAWVVIGLVCGYAIGSNHANKTRERLNYQNQLKSKDKEIELLEDKLKTCQKWSKTIAEDYAAYRKQFK